MFFSSLAGTSPSGSARRPWALVLLLGLASWGAGACSDSSSPSDPPTPTTLSVVAGQGAQAPGGTVLPEGPTVRVLDQDGLGLFGVQVTFQVLEGGGELAEATATTDGDGEAQATWVLGREAGSTQRLEISAGDLTEVVEAQAVPVQPGASYKGRRDYIEYLPGSLPLVLTAPHGGDLEPLEIPDRGWGTTVTDLNTRDLALRIRDAIHDAVGAYPHLVICHLDRVKLDANRDIDEGAQNNWAAERAWWEYHTFSDEAGELVEEIFGQGLYLDIHGHGHEIQRIELGYLLSSTDLARSDEGLSTAGMVTKSSIGALVQGSGETLAELVRGPLSLGTLLQDEGFPSIPSATQQETSGEPYFTGGYSTVRHGSRDGGQISGIQLEHNYRGLRDEATNRQRYAEALTAALQTYFPTHFGFDLAPAATSAPVEAPPIPAAAGGAGLGGF